VVDGTLVTQVCGDDLLDDLLQEILLEGLKADILRVLSGDDNSVNTKRDGGTTFLLVFNGDLSLGVGTKPRKESTATSSSHGSVQLVREDNSEGHELFSLVCRITEHDTLITSTVVLEVTVVKTLSDIGRLLLNGDEDVASLVIETLGRVIVSNVADGVTDDLLVVQLGVGGDFTKDHDHTSLRGGFATDLGVGVLSEAGIELNTLFSTTTSS
jgi:hypothetical protein